MILKQMVLKFNTNSLMLWLLLFWNIYHENWIYFTFANIFAFSHFWTIFWRKLLGKMFSSRYFYFQRNFIKIFLFFFVKIGSKYSRWEVHCSIQWTIQSWHGGKKNEKLFQCQWKYIFLGFLYLYSWWGRFGEQLIPFPKKNCKGQNMDESV